MENQKPCIVTVENNAMIIKINRPEDANRIDTESMQMIAAALDEANSRQDVKCIVLTGDRDNFCCGGRIDPNCSQEEKEAYSESLRGMQQKIMYANAPVIAAVEGNCIAGGNDLLACADIAVAREGVMFGFPEITYGAFPVMVMINTIDIIPKKKLLPYFYTGELFDAQAALGYGMLTEVVDDEQFWPAVQKYVDAIVRQPLKTLSLGRRAYLDMLPLGYEKRVALGQSVLQNVWKEQAASGKTY